MFAPLRDQLRGPLQRRVELPLQPTVRAPRVAIVPGEDEVVDTLVAAAGALLEQHLPQRPEHRHQAFARLRLRAHDLAVLVRGADADQAALEVDVVPAQPEHLSAPQPGARGDQDRAGRVGCARRDNGLDLLPRWWLDLPRRPPDSR